MNRLVMSAFAVCALGITHLCAQAPIPGTKASPPDLVGTYHIVAGERSGQKLTDKHLNKVMCRINGKSITTFVKEENAIYAADYQIDSTNSPWKISMTATLTPDDSKGTKAQGLIDINGDTVRLIYALPGGSAPTSFTTGDKQQMFVLRKLPK